MNVTERAVAIFALLSSLLADDGGWCHYMYRRKQVAVYILQKSQGFLVAYLFSA